MAETILNVSDLILQVPYSIGNVVIATYKLGNRGRERFSSVPKAHSQQVAEL